jgi:hypothetical protein
MIQVNPGNILAFQKSQTWQRQAFIGQNRTPFGLICPRARLLPFQLYFTGAYTSHTWLLSDPADPSGSIFEPMTAGDLDVDVVDGGFFVTWKASGNLSDIPPCGYWEVWLTVNGVDYFSEVLQVIENEDTTRPRLRFTNSKDKGQVLYQTGYEQFFYPRLIVPDRSDIDRERRVQVDGYGDEVTLFSRTVNRAKFEVPDIPDYCLPFFAKCGDLDSISYGTGNTLETIDLVDVRFESRPQGLDLNIGVFSFVGDIEAFNGCQENFEIE